MKKRLILLSIILFPSLIYLFFELTKANFKKMAYYGPKTINAKGDTVYYSVPAVQFAKKIERWTEKDIDLEGNETVHKKWKTDTLTIDTVTYPVYLILFLDSKLKKDGYKLAGLYDFIHFKPNELKQIPIIIVSDLNRAIENDFEFDSLKISLPGFHAMFTDYANRTEFLAKTYFKQKPIHVFDYFIALVDKQRHIRGYYDPTFNAEVKRMIADYKHLKIRDGYAETQKQNDIKQNEGK